MFNKLIAEYEHGLRWVLRHQTPVLFITLGTVVLSFWLYVIVPKGFFPQQDTAGFSGEVRGQQDVSFKEMTLKMHEISGIVQKDPAVENVMAFVGGGPGGGSSNQSHMFVQLKPLKERDSAEAVVTRLRPRISHVPGASLYLQPQQDLKIGGRSSAAQYQFTMASDNLTDLHAWVPILTQAMQHLSTLRDVVSDYQDKGLREQLVIDRDTASRLGITPSDIDNALYDAFGQRQVSTIYSTLNQYHVVIAVPDEFQMNPDMLNQIYVRHTATGTANANAASAAPPILAASARPLASTTANTTETGTTASSTKTNPAIPLSAVAHFQEARSSLTVNHQGPFPAATISFNLAPGVSLSDATAEIENAKSKLGLPGTIHTGFAGSAQAFQDSLSSARNLIFLAIIAVYIVLGMLYESFIHPLTILSTLPSAGVGALLALLLFKMELSVIAMIGIILLIGIVKKNAIMMIDFALVAEREHGKSPEDAIYEACMLRFRPIMMTTMAAMLGGLPLALGRSMGSELRRPLGVTIVGGLLVSQMLTLFTTPAVYLFSYRARDFVYRCVYWLLGIQPSTKVPNRPPRITPPELQGAARD